MIAPCSAGRNDNAAMTSMPYNPAAFRVPADAYDALIGRFLPTLAPAFADAAGVRVGMRALDVGCGPGGLTAELVRGLGAVAVSAINPSPPFVQACRARLPGIDAVVGTAEDLPFEDGQFDVALASLVVPFMTDPVAGVREMARVTAPGGAVALCFWDLARMPTIRTYWEAVGLVLGESSADMQRLGSKQGQLADLLRQAGITEIEESVLTATARCTDFHDWWRAFAAGAGPVGQHLISLVETDRERVREACYELLGRPEGSFELTASAWCAVGAKRVVAQK